MSIEPVPYPEAHEPNTKKKLQSAAQFAMERKPEGLAGLIMWLPGDAKGLPREYASYNHPVVILSPSIPANNTVEILGMTSFGGKGLTRRFTTSRKGMRQRARFLPIEPTPPHPDTPERNVMLRVLPYSPRTPSYVDGSLKSRKTVLLSELAEYYHYDVTYGIYPRFYLDKDSYQKLAAFVGFSTVKLLHAPADPKLPLGEQLAEQLADTNGLESSFLPNHDADKLLPCVNQQAKPATTTQAPRATEPPLPTYSRPTSPAPSTPSVSLEERTWRQEFDKAFHRQLASQYGARNVYGPRGPLDLSKPARNNIRLAMACVAMLAAGRGLSRSTVGREVLKEAIVGVKAIMLAGASKTLVIAVMGVLAEMTWAVVRHSGRNWGRYITAGFSACLVQVYKERNPGGSTRWFKLEQIVMLVWDVACLRIWE